MTPRRLIRRLSLKVRLALAGTVAAAVVLIVLTIGINEVVKRALIADIDSRLGQGTAAVSKEISEPPSEENAIEKLDADFREPILAWRFDSVSRPLPVPDITPLPPPLDVAVGTSPGPHDINLGSTHFRVMTTRIPDGGTIATGVSLATVDSTLTSLHHVEELVEPAILVLFLAGGYAVARSALQPVERLRSTAERVGTEADAPRFGPTRPLDELGLLASTFDHMLDRLDLIRDRGDHLAAEASHGLRTPLGVIEAETSLALERPRDAAYYQGTLERVGGEVARMRRVVDELLWLARTDNGATIPPSVSVDIASSARDAALRLRALARARMQDLEVEVPAKPAFIRLPEGWVERLLDNLVENACKYSPADAVIRVRVTSIGRAAPGHGGWILDVVDTGPGIAEADRERVMGRYERAAGAEPGSGLGLAIVDTIVRSSNGSWAIDAADGGGTRVTVAWPDSGAPS